MPFATGAAPAFAMAFADQARLDVHAAHDGQAVHAQDWAVGIGVQRRALAVLEAAHDRAAIHLDGQVGRHDDVHAAHDRRDV